jgi:hypothetical protein
MEALPVAVSGSLYKSALAMIKELKKLVIKLTRDGVSCSPSVIQMFDETKRWFMDRVKVHFATSQKRYLQWRWRAAEKMFLQFKDGKPITAVAAADVAAAASPTRRPRKRMKVATAPSNLTVIPEGTAQAQPWLN